MGVRKEKGKIGTVMETPLRRDKLYASYPRQKDGPKTDYVNI